MGRLLDTKWSLVKAYSLHLRTSDRHQREREREREREEEVIISNYTHTTLKYFIILRKVLHLSNSVIVTLRT